MEPQYPKCSLSDESLEGQIETSDIDGQKARRGAWGAVQKAWAVHFLQFPRLGVGGGPHSEGVEGSQSPSP